MAQTTIDIKIDLSDYVNLIDDKDLIREVKRRLRLSGKTADEFLGTNRTLSIETPTDAEFVRFNNWIDKNAPNIRKIKDQITIEEYRRLTEKYNGEQIRKVLTDLGNYKDAPKRYVSVNLTFQKWAKKEYG